MASKKFFRNDSSLQSLLRYIVPKNEAMQMITIQIHRQVTDFPYGAMHGTYQAYRLATWVENNWPFSLRISARSRAVRGLNAT